MDSSTLERLADFICGDDPEFAPMYRTGSELTRFFRRAGLHDASHDGTTRKWWTLDMLNDCSEDQLLTVIERLASPKEYGGDVEQIRLAQRSLNQILSIEELRIRYDGIMPIIEAHQPDFNPSELESEGEFKPSTTPDFYSLGIENHVAEILEIRWYETERCVNAEAYLAATIIMGSLLEGLILSVLQKKPRSANTSPKAPRDKCTNKVKTFAHWTLNDMIEVAHSEGWIDLDVKEFSHALRSFRNLIHPYEQMSLQVFPDEDTCAICWLVVQATVNDLATVLRQSEAV